MTDFSVNGGEPKTNSVVGDDTSSYLEGGYAEVAEYTSGGEG